VFVDIYGSKVPHDALVYDDTAQEAMSSTPRSNDTSKSEEDGIESQDERTPSDTQRCLHTTHSRLRFKRGVTYFGCSTCGYRWRKYGTPKADSVGAQGLMESTVE